MRNVAQGESQLMVSLGEAIASCRNTLEITQAELAEQIGCTEVLISEIEQGVADINLAALDRCAAVFGISIVELLELADTLKVGGSLVCLDFSGADEAPRA